MAGEDKAARGEADLAGMKVGHAKAEIAEGDTILTLRVGGNGETRR